MGPSSGWPTRHLRQANYLTSFNTNRPKSRRPPTYADQVKQLRRTGSGLVRQPTNISETVCRPHRFSHGPARSTKRTASACAPNQPIYSRLGPSKFDGNGKWVKTAFPARATLDPLLALDYAKKSQPAVAPAFGRDTTIISPAPVPGRRNDSSNGPARFQRPRELLFSQLRAGPADHKWWVEPFLPCPGRGPVPGRPELKSGSAIDKHSTSSPVTNNLEHRQNMIKTIQK